MEASSRQICIFEKVIPIWRISEEMNVYCTEIRYKATDVGVVVLNQAAMLSLQNLSPSLKNERTRNIHLPSVREDKCVAKLPLIFTTRRLIFCTFRMGGV